MALVVLLAEPSVGSLFKLMDLVMDLALNKALKKNKPLLTPPGWTENPSKQARSARPVLGIFSFKKYRCECRCVNERPVRCDMAIPASGKLSEQSLYSAGKGVPAIRRSRRRLREARSLPRQSIRLTSFLNWELRLKLLTARGRRRGRTSSRISSKFRYAAENGLKVMTPERRKSAILRVTTVSLCSRAVAAINPSVTGRGRFGDSLPQQSPMEAVMGKMRSA